MGKFTQQQLEEAYEEMRANEAARWQVHELACEWLRKKTNLNVTIGPRDIWYSAPGWGWRHVITPKPQEVALYVEYSQYDGIPQWLTQKKAPNSNFVEIDLSNEPGFAPGTKYAVGFQYYDAHVGGY